DHLVLLHMVPGADLLADGVTVLVGDEGVLTLGTELPAVVGALDALALDLATVTQAGPQVAAVGVEDGEFALQGAKGHQLVAEVFHRFDPTRGDFPAPGDVEPAGGFHGDILDHGASGMSVGG